MEVGSRLRQAYLIANDCARSCVQSPYPATPLILPLSSKVGKQEASGAVASLSLVLLLESFVMPFDRGRKELGLQDLFPHRNLRHHHLGDQGFW